MEAIFDYIVFQQQKSVVLTLIRELQQFVMAGNSATTDNSMVYSEAIENLEHKIQTDVLSLEEGISLLVDFAYQKLDLNIDGDQIKEKMDDIQNNVDYEGIQNKTSQLKNVKDQISLLSSKIKQINERITVEIDP